ncbi:caspase-6-like [Brienomyrus brachyistius]|uniref:caspase-6-like n=1 Tax=Brienomyrus brachyistius TaxID=42636 RepID=UPI0020B351F4|nr:caspase-6-like [Brienomyrus brachyistius]
MADSGKDDVRGSVEIDSKPEGESKNICETDALPGRRSIGMDPAEEYQMNHRKRGLALIFNQEWFFWQLRLPERTGTNADKANLVKRFAELGFDAKSYDNLKVEEVMNILQKAARDNHVDSDCFVCVFLSHGENDHIYAYDGQIRIRDITALFKGDQCKSLVGKPKIFILQACRGDKHDDPVTPMEEVDNPNQVVVDAGVFYTLPAGADFLMCYSVAEGYYSHRETVNGSWYIQDLCDLLREYGQSVEFTELLMLVNRKVSMRSVGRCADRNAIGKKQVPCFCSMLTKKLYFRPRKV